MIHHISKFRTEKDQTDMDTAYGAEQVTEEKDVPGGTQNISKETSTSTMMITSTQPTKAISPTVMTTTSF